jgi:hypothetical protein
VRIRASADPGRSYPLNTSTSVLIDRSAALILIVDAAALALRSRRALARYAPVRPPRNIIPHDSLS